MAFIVPRPALTPRRRFEAGLAPGCKVVRASELQAFHDANALLDQARQEAERITAQAREAYEAERRRGYADGKEEARLEEAELMIENVTRNVEFFSKVESRMVDLVLQAVQKIIDDFDDRDRVMLTVRNVLSVVRNQKQMTLRLHPAQVEVVKSRINELLAAYPGVGYLDIMADSRLKPDACILETEIGLVEASLDTQIAALRSAFQKVLGSRV